MPKNGYVLCMLCWLIFASAKIALAQSAYLPIGSQEEYLAERLAIKTGSNGLQFNSVKPFNIKRISIELQTIDSLKKNYPQLTPIDLSDLSHFLTTYPEWNTLPKSTVSKKPLYKAIYQTPSNFYELNTPDFFLAINPLLHFEVGKDNNFSQKLYSNRRGFALRGVIAKKIWFNSTVIENQEQPPLYAQQWINEHQAVPGVGYYKNLNNTALDYWDAKASVGFNLTNYIDVQLGYDKNFIGNGYRSLLLSDFSNNALFLKLNTRIWKLNYENLYMQLVSDYVRGADRLLPRKYLRINHLSLNLSKNTTVGIFDAIVFARTNNQFDYIYALPLLFLISAQQQAGSPDNALLGFDFKTNIKKRIQVYGQLMFDEFTISEILKQSGYWANKYGYQLGIKFIDAFHIPNLDIQLETNRVRPFTYTHSDMDNYTNYNQPLAHPLGANFQEYIAIIKYRPTPRWYLQTKLFYYEQGLNLNGVDYGASPFEPYTNRTKDYGYTLGDGNKVKCLNAFFSASYEWKRNLFLDANAQLRDYNIQIGTNQTTSIFSFGVRLNIIPRVYHF